MTYNPLDTDIETAAPVERVEYLMARLRDPETGCPWDQKQSFSTIAPYTVEEAYEVADAIEQGDMVHLKEELGDLLFQVIFYAQLAREQDQFDFDDIATVLEQKLVRRHPHVFPEGTLESGAEAGGSISEEQVKAQWDEIKKQEKQSGGNDVPDSLLDGIPKGMSPLKKALQIQKAVAKAGFDWNEFMPAFAKLEEEVQELKHELEYNGSQERVADELADVMFTCVNLARHLKQDPEYLMTRVNNRFEGRFRFVEEQLREQGLSLEQATLEQIETAWSRAKKIRG